MNTRSRQRRALGEFLRARREAAARADLGYAPMPRTRTSGLRREEVAMAAGVSVTWYTWLEQGREINPSRQVLDAISAALRLTPAERDYVRSLGGHAPDPVPADVETPAHVQRFLDALGGYPAFAIGPFWDITAWNSAYAALYPNIAVTAEADRNLLWLMFMDPAIRELLPDWENDSSRFLAEFRAEAGSRAGEPAYSTLVDRLRAASGHFESQWRRRSVQRFTSRERRFFRAGIGEMRLEHHQLAPVDVPNIQIVAYLPVPDSGAAERLAALVAGAG